MLRCIAVCCSVLQRVAVCCSVWQCQTWRSVTNGRWCSTMLIWGCSVLQCVAVCCSVRHGRWMCVLQWLTLWRFEGLGCRFLGFCLCCSVLQCVATRFAACCCVLRRAAVCCNVWGIRLKVFSRFEGLGLRDKVSGFCFVLQCAAVCCSGLQRRVEGFSTCYQQILVATPRGEDPF